MKDKANPKYITQLIKSLFNFSAVIFTACDEYVDEKSNVEELIQLNSMIFLR